MPPTLYQIAQAVDLAFIYSLTDEERAKLLGISRRTLARWKYRRDYQDLYIEVDAAERANWGRSPAKRVLAVDLVRTRQGRKETPPPRG